MKITEPGLVFDMDDETYHADPVPDGSLSSTFARLLTNHVPAKADAIRRNFKPTKSMDLGKAAHLAALGVGPELITYQHDGRTKAGKAEREAAAPRIASQAALAVTAAEREQVEAMAAALMAHDEVRAIFAASKREVSGFWQEGGIWCRARYDLLSDDVAFDYKTTEDASADGFERAMADYAYHQQANFYQRGLQALAHPAGRAPMRFICQEKREPYLVQIHSCDELAMEIAHALNERAISLYAHCKQAGEWPGYPSLDAEPTALPNRYFFRYADLLPPNLNPFSETVA